MISSPKPRRMRRAALIPRQKQQRPSGARLAADLRSADADHNCSNNYGPYHFPEKLIPLMTSTRWRVNRCRYMATGSKSVLAVCGRSRPRAVLRGDHRESGETYNIGGHNERKNLDVVETFASCWKNWLRTSRTAWCTI